MLLVLLLAVASSACAALSTVFKHRAAQHAVEQPADDGRADGEKLPRRGLRAAAVAWVANPTFAIAMVFDGLCVVFQILALKYGSLSVVQPVLCMSLVISLGLNHVMLRTRPTRSEILHSLTLVAGLVMFLLGRIPAVGDRVPLPHHPSVDDDEAEAPQWSARVARMDGRRVDLVEVTHE
mgnify:CR=1 FL=1